MHFYINDQKFISPVAATHAALEKVLWLPRESDEDLSYRIVENLTPQTEGCFQFSGARPLTPIPALIGTLALLSERMVPAAVCLFLAQEKVVEIEIR